MFDKFIHFIKYNNAAVFIIVLVFVVGASAFASEPGREAIGKKTSSIVGVDNTLLLEADLDNFDMDFKIEKIEEDEKYYYITYTFIELSELNGAWQYGLKEKERKISKNIKEDLGVYFAKELEQEYYAKIKDLKLSKEKAEEKGESKRVEVTEYSGLIGKTLNIASKVFKEYEPVKKKIIETPVSSAKMRKIKENKNSENLNDSSASGPDNLTEIYFDYIKEKDPDADNIFGSNDNCPYVYNPDQVDSDGDGVGDVCDIDNINSDTENISDSSNENSSDTQESGEGDVQIVDLDDIDTNNNEDTNTNNTNKGSGDNSEDTSTNENTNNTNDESTPLTETGQANEGEEFNDTGSGDNGEEVQDNTGSGENSAGDSGDTENNNQEQSIDDDSGDSADGTAGSEEIVQDNSVNSEESAIETGSADDNTTDNNE
jgi:hypothetical protein